MAAIDFGSDYSSFKADGSYGLTYRRISGPRVPLEGIGRRWINAPGDVPWDPNSGADIFGWENHDPTPADLVRLGQTLAAEARQVDYVIDAAVSVRLVGDELTVNGQALLADRTRHPLLLTASQAGVFFSIP